MRESVDNSIQDDQDNESILKIATLEKRVHYLQDLLKMKDSMIALLNQKQLHTNQSLGNSIVCDLSISAASDQPRGRGKPETISTDANDELDRKLRMNQNTNGNQIEHLKEIIKNQSMEMRELKTQTEIQESRLKI